jgi:hypothetical protein
VNELIKLADELLVCYEAKKDELDNLPGAHHVVLSNYKTAIDHFKEYIPKATKLASRGHLPKSEIILGFRNEANFLKSKIGKISS